MSVVDDDVVGGADVGVTTLELFVYTCFFWFFFLVFFCLVSRNYFLFFRPDKL